MARKTQTPKTIPLLIREAPIGLHPAHPSCTTCDLHKGPTHPGVPTVLFHAPPSPTHNLLFVGQNPGFEEDRQSLPFVGKSGRIVRDVYPLPFLPFANIYLTNTARCFTPGKTEPSAIQYTTCFMSYLWDDIAHLLSLPLPLYICLLGKPATTTFHSIFYNTKPSLKQAMLSGVVSHTPLLAPRPFYHISTYHPAALLHQENHIHTVRRHLQRLHSHMAASPTNTPSMPTVIPLRLPPPP